MHKKSISFPFLLFHPSIPHCLFLQTVLENLISIMCVFVSGAVIWQLFLGGLMSVNSPLTDPVSISRSLSLSHFPPLCLCLLVSWGQLVTYVQHCPLLPPAHTHTHTLTHTRSGSVTEKVTASTATWLLCYNTNHSRHKKRVCVREGEAPSLLKW